MEFGLLGALSIHDGQRTITIASPKQRTVLATLLLRRNRIVRIDELVERVWDESPPADARAALHNHVMRLRQALGPAAASRITTQPPGYMITTADAELDLDRFRRLLDSGRGAARTGDWPAASTVLHAALALWRADPLHDVPSPVLHLGDGPRLRELHAEALHLRIEADLHVGRHRDLVTELTGLAAATPLRESLHGQLMLALYRSGRQADALAHYQRAREFLAAELGIDPGPALRQLHHRILVNAPDLAAPPTSPAPTPAVRVPAQLPPDTADFTGRSHEVAELHALLAGRSDVDVAPLPTLAIVGAGGFGKTTLAVHVAHRARLAYPDGQLYIDLQGAGPAALAAHDVIARFLRDLGLDATGIPDDEHERSAIYRTVLADRRILLLLDNARDTAQIRTLLPANTTCTAIVTSRNRLPTLPGTYRIPLDSLTPEESHALLVQVSGKDRVDAEPDAASDIVTACDGLPLAIRIAAARLVARPDWTLRTLADRLTDTHARLDVLSIDDIAIRTSFQVSYDQLAPDDARTFRYLGTWNGPSLSQPAAAALLGRSPARTEESLAALMNTHLLQSATPGRYRLHDLLHTYATERADHIEPSTERSAATSRLLTWYLHTAVSAAPHLRHKALDLSRLPPEDPGHTPLRFRGRADALAWLESELDNLVTATAAALTVGPLVIGWQLPVLMFTFFQSRSHWDEWLTTYRNGLIAARRLNDLDGESRILNGLGVVLHELRRPDEALVHFQEALRIQRITGSGRRAATLGNLGHLYETLGRYDEAATTLGEAVDVSRRLGDRSGEASALNNLGLVHSAVGRYTDAASCLRQAAGTYQSIGTEQTYAKVLSNLGVAYLDLGDQPTAEETIRQALAIQQRLDARRDEATSLVNLGDALCTDGRTTEGRALWHQALAVMELTTDPRTGRLQDILRDLAPSTIAIRRLG